MKKKTAAILCVAALFAVSVGGDVTAETYGPTYEYTVSGGKAVYDFSDGGDKNHFDFYTEFDAMPDIVDGKIVCWSLAEQKIVYKNAIYADVDVSVDISTINNNGKFDAGIYVGLKSGVSGALDGVTGYCVNLERGADKSTYYIKIHEFDHRYLGAKAEIGSLVLPLNVVRLRVVIKDGMLYAFAGGSDTPQITYDLGDISGYVGFRSFYSPNTFDNIEIIGSVNEVDTTELTALTFRAQGLLSSVTDNSRSALEAALAVAEQAAETKSAYEIDRAVMRLKTAIGGAIVKRNYATLLEWLAEADTKTNADGNIYTANSWASFCKVREMCRSFSVDSDAEDLSYWANRLRLRIDSLIAL